MFSFSMFGFSFCSQHNSNFSGFDVKQTHYEEIDEPTALIQENQQPLSMKEDGTMHGFRVASVSDYHPERYLNILFIDDISWLWVMMHFLGISL